MRKPNENKKFIDPGQLRHTLIFTEEQATDNGSGGTTVMEQTLLETKGAIKPISQYNQMVLQAGATVFNGDVFFIIRKRNNFYPSKTMKVDNKGIKYTIHGVIELDDPCTFIQILCLRSE